MQNEKCTLKNADLQCAFCDVHFAIAASLLLVFAAPLSSRADEPPQVHIEDITFLENDRPTRVTGRVVVEDSTGGVLLESVDGRQWVIEAGEVQSRRTTERVFSPLTHEELAAQMLDELPAGFQTHITPHYVVCFNTTRAYAQWTSSLLERLHRAFTNYWSGKGLDLHEPEFPLVVIVYATAEQYQAASRPELGAAAGGVIGYYSLVTNRIRMYDLTGAESVRDGRRRGSLKQINQMLAQPSAAPLVATVVHEATHQIAFNCGLQTRLADLPLWLVEGMAVYFEAPDFSSSRGWRGIGKVNYPRLRTFQANLSSPRRSTLLALVAEDKPLRNSRTAVNAYADAWALNYFLIRYHPDQYTRYVEALSQKPPLVPGSPGKRIEEFRQHFGDPAVLEKEFLKRMSQLD